MAIVVNKKNLFEPIVIEIDGKTIELCSCGQTKKEDRTCDEAHDILNAEIKRENSGVVKSGKSEKTLTLEQVLNKLNKELKSEKHECACGGNCQCGGH